MLQKSDYTAWSKEARTDKCLNSLIPLSAMTITAQKASSNIKFSLSLDMLREMFTAIFTCLSVYKGILNYIYMT